MRPPATPTPTLSPSPPFSCWLLLIITAGAMIFSLFYERRLWCRFLCPIGGQNGLFAKLAITEVRARKGVCGAECSTYGCIKVRGRAGGRVWGGGSADLFFFRPPHPSHPQGNETPVPPEGLVEVGCPLGSHPGNLADNKDCVLCLDCLRTCPHGSVELRLRPPAADILTPTSHNATPAEVALMFMLLGSVPVHHVGALAAQAGLGADPAWLAASPTFLGPHAAAAAALLAAPGAIAWAVDAGARWLGPRVDAAYRPPPPFVRLAYAWLPVTWAAILAHYEDWGLTEAGQVLRVAAAGLGASAETVAAVPGGGAHPAVVAFLQGATLLFGLGTGVGLTVKYTWRRPLGAAAPQVVLMCAATAELWALILP